MNSNETITVKSENEPYYSEHVYPLDTFQGVHRKGSIWRAMRRGKADPSGFPYPKRPFSNSKRTRGRWENEARKVIYELAKKNGRIRR